MVCKTVPPERRLARAISMTITMFKYNPGSKKRDRQVADRNPGPIATVPAYPEGFGEPCRPSPRRRRR